MQRFQKVCVRTLGLALAAGLALTGCSSEAYENQPGGMGLVMQQISS
jgi:hypothetical protein